MPHRIVVGGVARDFEMAVPAGWIQYLQDLDQLSVAGLPVVIALHDDGQVPEIFRLAWNFFTPIAADPYSTLDDRFITFYPHATAAGQKLDATGIVPDTLQTAWNYGWSSRGFPRVDEAAFILAMLAHGEGVLRATLDAFGLVGLTTVFDPTRIFLFGLGTGASTAFRLTSDSTLEGRFAALFALNGSCGGRPNMAAGAASDVLWTPAGTPGVKAMSLYHYWGDLDDEIRQEGPGLRRSVLDHQRMLDAGIPDPDALQVARGDLDAATAIEAWKTFSLATAPGPAMGLQQSEDLTSNTVETIWIPPGAPGGDLANPQVRERRDPTLAHVEVSNVVNVRFVWDWFKAHPQVP